MKTIETTEIVDASISAQATIEMRFINNSIGGHDLEVCIDGDRNCFALYYLEVKTINIASGYHYIVMRNLDCPIDEWVIQNNFINNSEFTWQNEETCVNFVNISQGRHITRWYWDSRYIVELKYGEQYFLITGNGNHSLKVVNLSCSKDTWYLNFNLVNYANLVKEKDLYPNDNDENYKLDLSETMELIKKWKSGDAIVNEETAKQAVNIWLNGECYNCAAGEKELVPSACK